MTFEEMVKILDQKENKHIHKLYSLQWKWIILTDSTGQRYEINENSTEGTFYSIIRKIKSNGNNTTGQL